MITPGRLVLVSACLVLMVTMSGCGGDSTVAPKAAAPSSSAAPSVDQAASVRAAFERYKTAALAKDGAAAAELLADTTAGFYDGARNAALTDTKRELAALPLATRVTALVMRGSLSADVLRSSTPKELLVAAVDAGLIGEDGLSNVDIGRVTTSGETARAAVIVRGTAAPFTYAFVRQDGQWKNDLLPLLDVVAVGLTAAAKEQGVTVDRLIDATLAQKYGREKYARLVSQPPGR